MNITIRPAALEDADGIATVHIKVWQSAYARILPPDGLQNLDQEARASRWRENFASQDQATRTFVAETEEGEIVGFASCGKNRDPGPMAGELYAIYILQDYQQKRIGRRMVSEVASALLAQGITSMIVWVFKDSPNRKFYEALGGVLAGKSFYDIWDEPYLVVAYAWEDIQPLVEG